MGFDNECIVNIQSLAGEYFCPVCRLLVYPSEAMQSQCTHLYCKPCLTYVVSTTRACPYDGYLVTEADSKPLTESNKALAETIGKIPVHCLYHRSGCTWQGTLSECTSHCSGCVFGNSPVVCNRCGIQIVHRQVQEHAQSCPGVQSQAQQVAVTQEPSATSTVASTDQNQTAAPVGAVASQALNSQTAVTTTTSGQDSSQLPNPASQSQPTQNVQTAAPTAEQWYQQQQYQQYYLQYPGQDPYQQQYQHYYPYQQPVGPQYQQPYSQPQPQSQSQPQSQPQPQPQAQHQVQPQPQAQHQVQPQPQAQHQVQPQLQPQGVSNPLPQVPAPVAPQPQNQMQVNQQQQQLQPAVTPHGQILPQSNPPGLTQALSQPQSSYPYPLVPHAVQPHPQPQQHMQIPPYQQPHSQAQHSQPQIQQPAQKYPVSQPQVHSQAHPNAPVQHLSQSQMRPHQSLTPSVQPQGQNASSNAVTGFQSYPQPQPQLHQSTQPGAPQHGMQMHAQSGPLPHAQHPVLMQNQFPQQIPVMFSNQQQPALLPSPVQGQGTPPIQQPPVYNPNQQPGPINHRPTLQPVQQSLAQQPFAHMPMSSHLRPQGPGHSFPRHSFPPAQGNPAPLNSTQLSQSQNAVGKPSIPNHPIQIQPFAHTANNIPVRPGQTGSSHLPENHNLLVGTNNQVQLSSDLQSGAPAPHERQGNATEQHSDSATGKLAKNSKDFYTASLSENELKSEKVKMDIKPIDAGNKQNGGDQNAVKTSGPNVNSLENGDSVGQSVGKEEVAENNGNEHSAPKGNENQDGPLLKMETKKESETDEVNNDDAHTSRPAADHGKQHQPMTEYAAVQQRSSAMLGSQVLRPAGPNDPLPSGHSSTFVRNHVPTHDPHLGQATMLKQPQVHNLLEICTVG
ncbi:chromatin modification-related protein eaf-1-like [Arachis ipaensis]|uniref:chromatin modification-related protein eaf-1-like n=1 Tax=Arachis ipaensis TaxID=130454 RepID=UPI0007AF6BBF|nr:chromatin modification-related protein eaf-1-like [Arachis ipaensis]